MRMILSVAEQEKLLYSIMEAAALLNVSDDTIRRMIASGELNAVKVRGQWRIKKESIDKFTK